MNDKTLDLDICTLEELDNMNYAIVGDGNYVRKLLEKLKELNIRFPVYLLTDQKVDFIYGVPTRRLSESLPVEDIVIGSDIYQYELISKCLLIKEKRNKFWDASSILYGNLSYYLKQPVLQRYIVVFSTNPSEHHEKWLIFFQKWLEKLSIDVVYRHPLQKYDDDLLSYSLGVLLWNGSSGGFKFIKEKLNSQKLKYSFVECGFFPQKDYFYFDKQGVNASSQLGSDELLWLPDNYKEIVSRFRDTFFKSVIRAKGLDDIVFIPLQLESDTNVLKNSRFKNGMQEFINYIETFYGDKKLVFKAHPKDPKISTYILSKGEWSNESSLSLIKSASIVHGINSTVLFEAALYGVKIVAEGSCLLNVNVDNQQRILAAILLRQFSVNTCEFNVENISKFSFLNIK